MATANDPRSEWLERVLGWRPPMSSSGTDGAGAAMAGWTAARATALASLKALEGAYRGMKHPLSDRGIVLLRAIQANLTAEPASLAQLRELEAYLTGDRNITEAEMPNGFGFKVELRAPLLAALGKLKRAVGSTAP